jgi:hypothetical protein
MHSQVFQDEVAHKILNGGFYVDIGAGDGFFDPNGGNSLFLEENGWNGILIEGDIKRHEYSKQHRKGISIHAMIPDKTIKSILIENQCPKVIDYISIDIEPSSLIALYNFPFEDFSFKFLTFEHDLYTSPDNEEQKRESHRILKSMGYVCMADNVSVPHSYFEYFEDWWINPSFFSKEFIEKNQFIGKDGLYILHNLEI